MQVAMCAYSFVRTLVNALVLHGKTPPAQVVAGDDDHDCKWSIFASWWKEKHHQCKLHSVNTILGTSIGAECSNQMQLAQGHHLNADLALVHEQKRKKKKRKKKRKEKKRKKKCPRKDSNL